MADVMSGLKKALVKSMEAIGATAGNIASSTKVKVNEMNLVNRRREILQDFGAQAYAMWQKGEHFPEELERQLAELSDVDAQLNAIRTERLANVKTDATPKTDAAAAPDAPETEEAAPETTEPETAAEPETTEPETTEPETTAAPETTEPEIASPTDVPTMDAPEAPELDDVQPEDVHLPDPSSIPTLDLGGDDEAAETPETPEAPEKADGAACPSMDQLLNKAQQFTQRVSDAVHSPDNQKKVDGAIDAIGRTVCKMGDAIDKAVGSMSDALKDHKDDGPKDGNG